MATKRINPDKLESVRVRYEDMSDVISSSDAYTEDESQTLIDDGTTAIQTLSQNIVTVVDSLDAYLNSVAQAFRESDLSLSQSIENGFQTYRTSDKTLQAQGKQADMSQNQYYSVLP